MSRMHNPPYPGLILRDGVLPALGLSVTEAAPMHVKRAPVEQSLTAA